jgi:hypothetical protein
MVRGIQEQSQGKVFSKSSPRALPNNACMALTPHLSRKFQAFEPMVYLKNPAAFKDSPKVIFS